MRAAKRLIGQWPHAKPPDPESYAGAIGAVLAQYPAGLVEECCDPRRGLARGREYPPTVAALVEWLDKRLTHHQLMAAAKPRAPAAPEPVFTDDHRMNMLKRLQELIHGIFNPAPTADQVKKKLGISDEVWDAIPDRKST